MVNPLKLLQVDAVATWAKLSLLDSGRFHMFGWRKSGTIGLALVLALPLSGPTYGQTSSETPDSIARSFVTNLKAGETEDAVNGYFAGGPMASSKPQELRILVDQIASVSRLYGPISECELIDAKKVGSLAESRLYLCQHDNFVTRWTLQMVRTKRGWTGGNLGFDDKFTLPLGER